MGHPVAVDHDKVGEIFLHSLGFPASVTQFVRGHVQVSIVSLTDVTCDTCLGQEVPSLQTP